jgi:uncharacterized protein
MHEPRKTQSPLPPSPALPLEDYALKIAANGEWYHDGGRINRIELVKLFASVLSCDASGEYWLITPAERGKIVVEDLPFMAVEMRCERKNSRDPCSASLSFRNTLDEWQSLTDPQAKIMSPPRPHGALLSTGALAFGRA